MTYNHNSKFDLQLNKAYELNLQIISWSKSDLQYDLEFEFGRHHHHRCPRSVDVINSSKNRGSRTCEPKKAMVREPRTEPRTGWQGIAISCEKMKWSPIQVLTPPKIA